MYLSFHTQTEVADQTLYLTQSQYTDTGLTSVNFGVTGMTRQGMILAAQAGIEPRVCRSTDTGPTTDNVLSHCHFKSGLLRIQITFRLLSYLTFMMLLKNPKHRRIRVTVRLRAGSVPAVVLGWLVNVPSTCTVCLTDGSAQTILRAATLR